MDDIRNNKDMVRNIIFLPTYGTVQLIVVLESSTVIALLFLERTGKFKCARLIPPRTIDYNDKSLEARDSCNAKKPGDNKKIMDFTTTLISLIRKGITKLKIDTRARIHRIIYERLNLPMSFICVGGI
jgi:hypothetical protein